jgi:hypothetical protein
MGNGGSTAAVFSFCKRVEEYDIVSPEIAVPFSGVKACYWKS